MEPYTFNPDAPLISQLGAVTGRQFMDQFFTEFVAFLERHPRTIGAAVLNTPEPTPPSTRYCYGLKGIMDLFHVSNMTAQKYKRTIIKDAVKQNGRKIVVDTEKALALFAEAQQKEQV